ncbi:hypothetical protein JD844_014585 [Phrynosoma platyrhinos]|uniref:Pleckstrin homology domain-containing family O member 2 n=1 Tax=Phrynosoma platyrhinos TaxID=52577 RepID=A0ABQ7SRV8_PHRPL|nr:hypothetical protein JD844_014585 [Phrynosoma platyrhinos]
MDNGLVKKERRNEGVKEESAEKQKCPTKADKAGWIKKSTGGLLSLWKERYIQLCKSQLLICENEEEQKCVETVELERYDRCQDLRALLKRKHRFILIRAPGYKVKVDESLSLEHVTRRRAKLAHGRRPPTRSHLKEVANAVSDGILRLDLDVPNSGPPNFTLVTGEADGISPPKETLKPPMPPTKSPKLPSENPNADSTPEDLELKKPPMPPAKPLKEAGIPSENMNSVEEEKEEEEDVAVAAEDLEDSQGRLKKPPVPPAKPHKEIAAPNENMNSVEEEGEVEDVVVTGENTEESKAGFKKPPVPPAKPLKKVVALTENMDLVEEKEEEREEEEKHVAVKGEDVEESEVAAGGESLMETDKNAPTAPVLSLNVLPDKMKVTWDSPASEQEGIECGNPLKSSSKDDLPEVGKDVAQPPTSPPKNLLEGIQDNMKSRWSSSEAFKGDHQGGGLKPPVNGFDDDGMTESVFHNGEEHLSLQKPQEPSSEPGMNEKSLSLPSNGQAHLLDVVRSSPVTKPRCASLEDLLSGSSKASLQELDPQCGAALHVAHMEKKVACEKERTEKLLQKVHQRGLEQAQEGNGPPLNAETLLNEAAAQLRQATQVLQEIRDLGELKKEQKGASKDLVTLYRRSAP